MYAIYEVFPGRIVLEYTDAQGEWGGGERVDIPRNWYDLELLAYMVASQRAACKGVRLERISRRF